MKILKIFGVVVAVHAAVFMFVFAIPGCRTSARSVPSAPAADNGSPAPTVSFPGADNASTATGDATPSMSGADVNPATSGAPMVSFNGGASNSNTQHFNPTRPGTPVAGVLESDDVTGVTPATTYKVASNDSLWKVAKKHGIGIDDLAKANNLRPNSPLKVGQKLIIPGKPASGSAANGASAGTRTYTVKAGESLGTVARKQGTTSAEIRALNPQLKNDNLRAGQKLTLPAAGVSAAAASSSTAPAAAPVTASTPAIAPAGSVEHIVKPGEGLSQIAKKYGVPMREIAALNNIANPTSLRAGQKILIPGVKTPDAKSPAPAIIPPIDQGPVAPAVPSETPVAPAASEASPVTTPSASDAPPVVKVEESAPVSASK